MPSSRQTCSWSVPLTETETACTLNALPAPDHAARRARNLDRCDELAELGMNLARAAHREALREMQPPPERTVIPGLPHHPTLVAAPRSAVFGQLFALISRCVRQTMLLEDRFAAGIVHHAREIPPHTAQPAAPQAADPAPPRQSCADRLRPERLERETQQSLDRPPEKTLAEVRAVFDAAIEAGLAPPAPTPEPATPRCPIPVIPPGPKAPLTAFERSVLACHQANARPRKPDS